MAKIRGTTVTLYEETITGYDPMGDPIKEYTPVEVENVLIGEPSSDDIVTSTSLFGKTISYMLGIPKGDSHDWMEKKVEWTDAHGHLYEVRTFGYPITGIEDNIPGPWHMKVRCEAYG